MMFCKHRFGKPHNVVRDDAHLAIAVLVFPITFVSRVSICLQHVRIGRFPAVRIHRGRPSGAAVTSTG